MLVACAGRGAGCAGAGFDGFVGGWWCAGGMPRRRDPGSAKVVYRTARAGLRVTRGQRRRLIGLLISAGDVWACILELNGWRRARQARPLASYQELCRVLAASGPGTFGDLDSAGARSVLRRYADAWFSAAKRRREGDVTARFPRRRRRMMPVRWYDSTYRLEGRVLQIPVARGCPPLRIRLDRDLPYPAAQVRSVTLLFDAGGCGWTSRPRCRSRPIRPGRSPTRAGWRGWTWGSSTRTLSRARARRVCWCPGGRSVPSTVSTTTTPRPGAGRLPAGRRNRVSADRGDGASTAGPSA